MKRIRIIGLALLALCAVSPVAAASAAHFEASKVAKLVAKVASGAAGEQVFTTKAGKVVCKALKVTAGESALKSETQKVTIQYENCKAFGLAATISPAEYLFHASGSVDVLKAITIKAISCEVTVPAQTGLKTVTYKNVNKEIEIVPNVTGIKSSGKGAACNYAEESKGTYTGNSLVGIAGGELKWNAT